MQLVDVLIHGLGRFGGEAPHRVRINGKLTALIGPNEVGKSTVLRALELGLTSHSIPIPERTRGGNVRDDQEMVRLRYRVEPSDHEKLKAVVGTTSDVSETRFFEVIRRVDGTIERFLDPYLDFTTEPRRAIANRIEEIADDRWPVKEDNVPDPDRAEMINVAAGLMGFDPNVRMGGHEFVERLQAMVADEEEKDRQFSEQLAQLVDVEKAGDPNDQAAEILSSRTPEFVEFNQEARDLKTEYDLSQPPNSQALANFAQLAKLDLEEFGQLVAQQDRGAIKDRKEKANAELKKHFDRWNQEPPIEVSVDNTDYVLTILVKSGEGETMKLEERSAGLRQFVALVALTAQDHHPVPPILLIDEVEAALHYRAQADLIQILETQTTCSQVVYTTHSAASLPEDIGAVRVIEGIDNLTASRVYQSFVQDHKDKLGLRALLMAMGASSLALVALRPAVIAEGKTEVFLLPALMREAIGEDHLGYAVSPGSSSATGADRWTGPRRALDGLAV